MSLNLLAQRKQSGEKIRMVTCYDYWSAKILAKTEVEALLVGDSVAMVVHGFKDTLQATVQMMATHTRAVQRAGTDKLIVTDLPFLCHRKGRRYLMDAVDTLMKAGAQALKIETAPGQESEVAYLVQSGVPVLGHLGLTPQYIHQFGGFKAQGRTPESAARILGHAQALEQAGVSALVLECVPSSLAGKITQSVEIPTIGIGAGTAVDGQVLVLQDLLGLNLDFKPRFVRQFAHGEQWLKQAIEEFNRSVNDESFPNLEESFL